MGTASKVFIGAGIVSGGIYGYTLYAGQKCIQDAQKLGIPLDCIFPPEGNLIWGIVASGLFLGAYLTR